MPSIYQLKPAFQTCRGRWLSGAPYFNELCDIVGNSALILPFGVRNRPGLARGGLGQRPAAGRRCTVAVHPDQSEHCGRIAHWVDELDLPEFDFFAWDARGQGQSPGARGDSPSFGTSVRDVQTFCDHRSASYPIDQENMAVIAQSVGAVIAATWVRSLPGTAPFSRPPPLDAITRSNNLRS